MKEFADIKMAKVYGPPHSYSSYTKSELLDWKKNGSHKPKPEEKEETDINILPSRIDDPIADVYGPPTPIDDPLVTPEEDYDDMPADTPFDKTI